MARLISITLYILQIIFFTNGQNVQPMPPVDSCAATQVALACSNNYVPVVRSASYGVAQVAGSCAYTPGDCIADAMNIVTYSSDTNPLILYATRRKLPECNDQYNSYVHLEYDCVPISMDDSTKEYNICQNGTEITTSQGNIRSPGYPSQFQIPPGGECFRAIHVPSDKTIRLWLSDLYIGSTSVNCASDHVYVVDSVQTFRFCGLKRYVYPYLCSSTILIQYLVKTSFSVYRGMRMYYDIVDRVANDNCPNPNGTVTPIPSTTNAITTKNPGISTTESVYVGLGIASPVQSFQLCKGDSYAIECPNNYVIAIRKNIFGTTLSDQCEAYDVVHHCAIATEPTFLCLQRCTYLYVGNRIIPSCSNKIAAYQYVEYQCIPKASEIVSPNLPCPNDGSKVPIQIDRRGRFQNYDYPNFRQMNCTYRLKTQPGHIMHIYALDISLNNYSPGCTQNKLTLIEDGEDKGAEFCEQRSNSLIYSSCSNELDLRYVVNDDTHMFSYGAQLYIETQLRPSEWSCGKTSMTPSQPTTNPTTPFTTPTAVPLTNETFIGARDELEHDICFGGQLIYTCPSGYTFMLIDAFYGVKKQASNKCGFVQGDCVQEALATITACRNDVPNCYLTYATRRRLARCSDNYADYLHVTSQCVPSKPVDSGSMLKTYDICETNDPISAFNAIVTSPNYPSYKQTNGECQRTIMGVQDRVLKIWINEMAVLSGGQRNLNDDSGEPDLIISDDYATDILEEMYPTIRDTCTQDYLIINAPHVAYVYCGARKLAILPICAESVIIQYKASSPPNSFYKGFKFYFEWVEKPLEIICGGNPIINPNTTTAINPVIPFWAQNLELSPILTEHICLGTSATLQCPRGSDYVLSIIESNYGVTGSGLCEIPSSNHCHQEVALGLTCTHSCFIEYDLPKPLIQCGLQNADYINIDYECIPTRLPNNANPFDICASTSTDTIAINSGIMISPQYPTLGAARTCSKKIETVPNKLWMVFIVDLSLEGENDAGVCNAASLTIFDGKDKITVCGSQQPTYLFTSCSNILEFSFISTHQGLGYRGFKIFFQTVDEPSNWACKLNTSLSTTTSTPRTTVTTLIPPSFQIAAYGGTTNGTRQYCKLPFIYQGNEQSTCLTVDPPPTIPDQGIKEPWCSLTDNFDRDLQWGFCELGITESTIFDICRSQSQVLKCPPNYLIDIITADYAAKPDGNIGTGACVYDKNDCFQNDASTFQSTCAGKPSCTAFHFVKTLAACQNRPSAYLHMDYTCIPNDIQGITPYNMCNNDTSMSSTTRRGFIISPNFPNTPNNLDCTFNLQTVKPNQDIYLYILDMDLNIPIQVGQACSKDRLIVTADNSPLEICGRSYTNFLINTCHASVMLQLIRASDARGRGVKFYFEFRERPPHEICPVLPPPFSTPKPSVTTTARPPVYIPDPSPRDVKTLCYPDLSGLFGLNNFQCPANYVIVIHRAFYGKGNRCDYNFGDCTTEADIVYRTCSGKQACSVSFINIVTLPECDRGVANYLMVEYQCLPTPAVIVNSGDLCTTQLDSFGGISGLLKSPSYPSYTQTQCANTTLSSFDGSNLVIYMYLFDLDIGSPDLSTGGCTNDYLLLSYQCNNQMYSQRLCGTRTTELLFSTCLPTDKIFASYNLLTQNSENQRGFALIFHLVPKSEQPTTIPTTRVTTITTTGPHTPSTPSTPRTTTTQPGPGPISTIPQYATTCVLNAITVRCTTPGYVLVLHKVQLGVSATSSCSYSSTDCFEDRTNLYNSCGRLTSCYIFAPSIELKSCQNAKSNYLYAEYQCIPSRPKLNLDVCSSSGSFNKVEGGAIISSANYSSIYQDCKLRLQSNTLPGSLLHQAFKIYILTLNLPFRPTVREQGVQCSGNDPFLEIDDVETGVTRLCGNSHTRYLLETCANTVEIRFNNFVSNTGATKFKGFELYLESIQNDQCLPILPPAPESPAFKIENRTACGHSTGRERVNVRCIADYGLVFLQSYHFVTKQPNQCDVSQYTCFYPSDQPQAQCSGQQTCTYTHTLSQAQLNRCPDSKADATQFYYQCLPMKPTSQFSKVTLCVDTQTSTNLGFIETTGFPSTYQFGRQQCSLRIVLSNNNDGKKYSVYLYVIELAIRDTSIINPSSEIKCFDSLTYTDGDTTHPLCGKIDQPILQYQTNQKELNLTLNISDLLPTNELNQWQGARLFYFIGDQALPLPPTLTTIPTIPTISTTSLTPSPESSATSESIENTPSPPSTNHAGEIVGIVICILAVLGGVIGYVYYRRRQSQKQGHSPTIRYDTDMVTVDGSTTNGIPEKRSSTSIPRASLKAPPSLAITSPFYKKSETTEKQELEPTSDA